MSVKLAETAGFCHYRGGQGASRDNVVLAHDNELRIGL